MAATPLEGDPMTPRPRTADDIEAAADALAAPSGPALTPLPTVEVLAHLAYTVHGAAIDLWALRDSIEHHEPHTEHALAELPRLAAHLDAATASVAAIAAMLGRPLPIEPLDLDGC
jgi:hypothetical protein